MNLTMPSLVAARLAHAFNLIALYGISLLLLVAFYYQLFQGELPCPLCLLQRVAFIMVGIGFLLNVRRGASPLHYGLVILSALAGAFASGRQVLLHIVPGSGSYGSALFGLHFYSWAFVAFVLILLAVGVILLVEARANGERSRPLNSPLNNAAGLLLLLLVLVNAASTLLECGFGPCIDNPIVYQWLPSKP